MKLSRTCARVVLVLVFGGMLQGLLLALLWPALATAAVVVFLACVICAVVLQFWKLRCVHCGKTAAPPRWSPGKTYYCSRCGNPFVFDDEP